MDLLEYEEQILLDAFHEDSLLVMARGLGIARIFAKFLQVYCDPKNLVIVLNTIQPEEEYFIEKMKDSSIEPLPRQVTADDSVSDRRALYLEGGVLFVTSRILVVDLLTDRMPADLISGILVYRAHKIIESCQEAFILRLYRQKNKKGFVKAFSQYPESFTAGFCHVERVMKSLFVEKLLLWPRFHASVVSCFERHQVDVVELHVTMTPAMTACQTSLLELISACLKELKHCNPAIDTDDFTVENSLTTNFDKLIRVQLDPLWNQLGPHTRQLISDIKTLRQMLRHLPQYDCVTFYNLVYSVRTNEKTFGRNSGWMFLDAADSLFFHAKERISEPTAKAKKQKTDDNQKEDNLGNKAGPRVFEECPKWKVLRQVLKEIQEDCQEAEGERKSDETTAVGPDEGASSRRVLVVALDDRTCSQIREFLSDGSQALLQRLYSKTVGLKSGTFQSNKESAGRSKASHTSTTDDASYYGVLQCPFTVLHPLQGSSDPHSVKQALYDLQPRYVIFYDADVAFVREVEIYRASRPGKAVRAYFLMYAGSTEEQRYLTSLRMEKEAFEYLIKQKAMMVISNQPSIARETDTAKESTLPLNTRRGGQHKDTQEQKVVVDMREFRSGLPAIIHQRGMNIEPVTIEVGDYILTPDICVERKSLSDLIGSLSNGRLYNQATAMCRYYKRPMLLIEFDPNKPFFLQSKYYLSTDIDSMDVTSRLTLLTIHFPRLRILWCSGPHATAAVFEELKMGQPQPVAADAMAIGVDTNVDIASSKYDHDAQAMLLKMPGVTTKNVYSLMNQVKDIAELVQLSQEQLGDLLDSRPHATALWTFLHKRYNPAASEAISGKGTSNKQTDHRGKRKTASTAVKRK